MATTLQLLELSSNKGSWTLTSAYSGTPAEFAGPRYDAFVFIRNGDDHILCAYRAADGTTDLFQTTLSDPPTRKVASINLGTGWSTLDAFKYYNENFLMTYRPDTGLFGFFSLGSDLAIRGKYMYSRFHAPAMSRDFTMVKSFVAGGRVIIMGYGFDSGSVCLYRIEGLVSSQPGAPPIAAHTVWDHVWAPGWTRFAFFTLGKEVFFLKTNTKFPNVNIDHVLDDPATGTSEVDSNMQLVDAQTLSLVAPFERDQGHPHFVAYRPDGAVVAYRIYSTCAGWSQLANAKAVAAAHTLLPVVIDEKQLFLLVAES
ncbi:hypothetical protein [Bradyrhizobium guangzhouense]|uniref:Uncharacterized protein n=1 Tax=Bradyrhizobium guangzhouense TaxID=1325095 RepID=A0AAE5X536_9BRAD|nr:hypothetical protein [Bradyrhizobium guangzhouense]QAU49042.1 hypothetical protein XH91_29225 [Bradyrhizobium guangzhouense]RXH10228.1 hypothetical protein EAS56_23450 [Bradyrhizobium guangzhouense]